MINIHEKTLKDLEFFTVLDQISTHTLTALGKEAVLSILPFKEEEQLMRELIYVNEYLSSFENDNRIPNHGFETISKELKLRFDLWLRSFRLSLPKTHKPSIIITNYCI